MPDLDDVRRLAARDSYLAVVATTRADGSVQASVVNSGVIAHPLTDAPVVSFVTYGRAKLTHLRARPSVTLTFRSGWSWLTVEGAAEIAGPDDPFGGFDADRLRLLLREVFTGAGGSHDDWAAYDRTMAEQRRAAVLVTPRRIYGN